MISVSDIYIAVCDAVRDALTEAGLTYPIIAGDMNEPVVRPSCKLDLSNESARCGGRFLAERALTIRFFFFPQDARRWRQEHFAIRDALAPVFLDCVTVGGYEVPLSDGIEFDRMDDVLIAETSLEWIEIMTEDDPAELMETLRVRYR